MSIIKSVAFFFLICCLFPLVPAQKRISSSNGRNVRLSPKHPSVYISFVRESKIASLSGTGEIKQRMWLHLNNNTRWAIWLEKSSVPQEYGDALLYYAVEDVKDGQKLYGSTQCHICSSTRLLPGKSLIFSLPNEDVTGGRRIRIDFHYDWESDDDVMGGREVQHSVFFSSLRDSVR